MKYAFSGIVVLTLLSSLAVRAYADGSCPAPEVALPDSTMPTPQPTSQLIGFSGMQMAGGSEGYSNNNGNGTTLSIRSEEQLYVRGMAPSAPVPSGSPTPCPSYTWKTQLNNNAKSDVDRVAVVMVKGSNPQVLSSAAFYTTPTDKTNPRSGGPAEVYSSMPGSVDASMQAMITATDKSPASFSANGVRYIILHEPAGSATYTALVAEPVTPGTLTFTTAYEVKSPTSGVQKTFGDFETIKYLPRLKFMTSAVSTQAETCSGVMRVSLVDGNGTPFHIAAGDNNLFPNNMVTINLSLSPATAFLDPNCLYNTSTMKVSKTYPTSEPSTGRWNDTVSDSYIEFYLESLKAQPSQQVSATFPVSMGLTAAAVQNQAITGASASQLVFSNAPSSADQGKCSDPVVVGMEDQYGNDTSPAADLPISVSKSGSTTLYSDAACSSAISGVTIPAGQKSATFYLKDNAAESLVLGISSGSLQGDKINIKILAQDLVTAPATLAQAQDMARRLYLHLAGKPMNETAMIPDWNVDPTGVGTKYPQLSLYTNKIMSGNILQAAYLATRDPGFYNITLWNMVTPLSDGGKNALGTTAALSDLNDFTATWIGIVRDDLNAQQLLTGNTIYVPSAYKPATAGACAKSDVYRTSQPYVDAMNAMYADPVNKSLDKQLVAAPQCVYNNPAGDQAFASDNPIVHTDAAGLLTTRQFALGALYMGTNRRAVRYALDRFLCHDITDVEDSSLTEWRIRRDVDHAPGGDPKIYQSTCRACHTTLDSWGGAFAFYDSYPNPNQPNSMLPHNLADWRTFYVSTGGYGEDAVMPKMNKNNTVFPPGYVTGDDSWINFLTSNNWQPVFGWSSAVPTQGNGVRSLGAMLANSDGFAKCMAKRVYQQVCTMGTPVAVDVNFNGPDAGVVSDLSVYFQSTNYNMRRLFQKAATLSSCLGTAPGVGGAGGSK